MSVSDLEVLSVEQIEDERSAILEALQTTRDDLDSRARNYLLDPEERAALRKLEILDYLAGGN